MEVIILQNLREIKKQLEILQKKLNVTITIKGKQVTVIGEALAEYEATLVLDALSFGFSLKNALLIKEEDFIYRKINIKTVTPRKNREIIRARIIGKEGKTKRTLEQLADCQTVINGNEVGIIGPAEEIETATTGIANLIRGSRQANVYRYLERINRERKEEKFRKK